jgi:beta-lactam-binding protein with PASTA domain
MKLLCVLPVVALLIVAGGLDVAMAQPQRGCTVPKLYALSLSAAKERLSAAGCRLGGVSFVSPRSPGARVSSQVPAPGAMLPTRTGVVVGLS